MKKIIYVLLLAISITACKNEPKQESTVVEEVKQEQIITSIYPETITKVFNAHGSIEQWNKMNALSFTMTKPTGKEKTTKDLKTRAELIETPTYTQGFDGETLWVNEKDGNAYRGKPQFYKGLMFYFYGMPFVFGDEGIDYKETEPLVFEGKTYPGILISYEAGVGESSDDQYKIFYDAETGQMEWLAYTVTFGKSEGSPDFHFIRYNNWQTVNGLVLPKSIDWYNYENNLPTEKRNTVEFTDVMLSEKAPDQAMFTMPEGAKVIE
ncbi:hypothetical protein ADIWIN_1988 [Winogradskyella psychrotolerans RS-3]|uniref:Threonine synthase n=1 Tax=Winogradskyella psychrotolerans RS-3 TaxID=641526 RepID=S7VRM6_9FLAO|nr:DUF6503 family protein [Winogradskyella psychrotolerans]EPR72900.1 hypothetical protein ADIWIN_1988 [Winogradskyella psychrotolerans RS-3]